MALKLGILASTNGTDLQAIIDGIKANELPGIELAIVVSNKADSGAIKRTQKAGFPTAIVEAKGKEREAFDKEVANLLERYDVDLILMIGYMRLVSPWFVERYRGKLINIHPSLLPKYPGMDRNVHEEVLKNGEPVTGCTLHFVDEGMDTGPIIMQHEVPVLPEDTVETLRTKVQQAEQEVILRALKDFRDRKL